MFGHPATPIDIPSAMVGDAQTMRVQNFSHATGDVIRVPIQFFRDAPAR